MRDKNYNGLRSSGLQVPIGSQMSQEERVRMAIVQQMRSMSQEIYIRAAVDMVLARGPVTPEDLAKASDAVARSYFVGLGVIQVEQPAQPPQDAEQP